MWFVTDQKRISNLVQHGIVRIGLIKDEIGVFRVKFGIVEDKIGEGSVDLLKDKHLLIFTYVSLAY